MNSPSEKNGSAEALVEHGPYVALCVKACYEGDGEGLSYLELPVDIFGARIKCVRQEVAGVAPIVRSGI